ncbi:MAG: NAD-binding protein [Candidatus Poseidoniaceae archaeon]|nr:NAD-binding protein [Candidatus Poseidoniaceae archaeon]
MRVIIGGAGRVGTDLAKALRAEDLDVVLVDSDSRAVKNAQNLDALVIHGDFISREKLIEAGIVEAEVFIAVTNSDERNLLACTLAEHTSASKGGKDLLSICRVRDSKFVEEQNNGYLVEWAKVNHVVNPLDGAIDRLHLGLKTPGIEDVIPFGHDAFVIELDVTNDATDVIFLSLKEAADNIDGELPLIIGVKREGEKSIVPDGEFVLVPNDKIAVATTGTSSFNHILKIFGHQPKNFPSSPKVAIIGANKIGQRVADKWLSSGASVTMIERDLQKANNFSGTKTGANPNIEVIHGDHLDREMLKEIGISEHHIAIAALKDDHACIAAALLASDMGVQRTGLMLYDADLVKVTQRMGITFAVDRKRVAVDNLLALIHTKTTGAYALLSTIPEIIGISLPVKDSTKFCGMKISEANFPEWMRIAFIQRQVDVNKWENMRPSPNKLIIEGDRLTMFCNPERVAELEKRFKV